MRVLYSSIVGASSVPWVLKKAWIGSQNVTAAPRKFQSTSRVDNRGTSPMKWSRQAVCTRISSSRGTRARAYAMWLGSVHLPGDARRTHVRNSHHLPFYDPKVEGRQVTRV
ncbi:hypothetical protein CRG98_031325 [Punica granatum]|uniref:Uncharacterized protein n=1 Tax=Punica granatum TaxID=22663 RepID=A0A2I0IWE5_PUNGR|nr:hypothetical protein CRG98_031325 [Punica granatum]